MARFRDVARRMGRQDDQKAKFCLHTDPVSVGQDLVAIWIAAAMNAFTIAKSTGASWPVHLSIEVGGKTICGTVEPSTGENASEPMFVPTTH